MTGHYARTIKIYGPNEKHPSWASKETYERDRIAPVKKKLDETCPGAKLREDGKCCLTLSSSRFANRSEKLSKPGKITVECIGDAACNQVVSSITPALLSVLSTQDTVVAIHSLTIRPTEQ